MQARAFIPILNSLRGLAYTVAVLAFLISSIQTAYFSWQRAEQYYEPYRVLTSRVGATQFARINVACDPVLSFVYDGHTEGEDVMQRRVEFGYAIAPILLTDSLARRQCLGVFNDAAQLRRWATAHQYRVLGQSDGLALMEKIQ